MTSHVWVGSRRMEGNVDMTKSAVSIVPYWFISGLFFDQRIPSKKYIRARYIVAHDGALHK